MSKQCTIITKDGSKWLRPVLNPSDTDQLSRFFQNAGDGFEDLPYIGTRPEGTILDESEVKGVRQGLCDYTMNWITEYDDDLPTYNQYRTAYTDAESHDIDYEKEMPHNQWPSTAYVAKKEDSQHGSNDYWKRRALAAEKYIAKSPCDPDIYEEQMVAYRQWQSIVKKEPK